MVLDADRADGIGRLQEAWRVLDRRGIAAYLELSRRGGHLWTFFDPGVPARLARRFILGVLPDLEGIEVFPKQDELNGDHPVGSLVRGPLGIHRLTGKRYPVVDPISLKPLSRSVRGVLELLEEAKRLGTDQVASELENLDDRAETAWTPPRDLSAPSRRRGRPSALEQLRERIGDPYAFISRFVALDASGKGHCPFHPPDHHPSFAVNRRGGYWTDFHEVNPRTGRYVGGDAIEFYKRLKGLTYKQVLEELAYH